MSFLDKVTNIVQGGGEKVKNFDVGGIGGSILSSPAMQKFKFWLTLIIGIGALCTILYLFFEYYLRYNKVVLVKKVKGGSIIDVYIDRGLVTRDKNNKLVLNLRKARKSCPSPAYRYVSKMGAKDYYEVYMNDQGDILPKAEINLEELEDSLKTHETISTSELAGWRLQEMKAAEEKFKKKSFIDKHINHIMWFATLVACVAALWITVNKLQSVSAAIYALAEAVKGLGAI